MQQLTPHQNNESTDDQITDDEVERFFRTHGAGDFAVSDDPIITETKSEKLIDKSQPTPREKMFARHVANGKSQTDAYISVFDPDGTMRRVAAKDSASKLMRRPRVTKYYLELMEERDQLAEQELPRLIAELNDAKDVARSLGQPASMVAAIKTKANLLGMENMQPSTVTINLGISEDQRTAMLERIALRASQSQKVIGRNLNDNSASDTPVLDAEFTEVNDE